MIMENLKAVQLYQIVWTKRVFLKDLSLGGKFQLKFKYSRSSDKFTIKKSNLGV